MPATTGRGEKHHGLRTPFYLLGDAAQVAFDFRYNKGQANRLLDLARDYLLTSRTMFSAAIGPAVDSLYSAAELTVQVQMLSEARLTRVHQARGEWLQANEDLGNTPQGFSAVLQRRAAGLSLDPPMWLGVVRVP